MRILQDDGSIARLGTIPLDSISDIKERRKIYHVSGRIVNKEKRELIGGIFRFKDIRVRDNSGEILYTFGESSSNDTFDKIKVGDRIDIIGRSSSDLDGTGSFSLGTTLSLSPFNIDIIRLLDNN